MKRACLRRAAALAFAVAGLVAGLTLPVFAQQPGVGEPAAEAPRTLPRELPLKRDAAGPAESPPWAAMAALLVIAGGAAVLVLRRRGAGGLIKALQGSRPGAAIERLASTPLTPQASVHSVRWQGEELLLGCTATQVTVLARRPAAQEQGPAS